MRATEAIRRSDQLPQGQPGEELSRRPLRICMAVVFAAAAATVASPALARAYHSQTLDGLIARCSTINTTTLPEASLDRYGVKADEERGLLSCVVQKQKPGLPIENTQAQIEATYHGIGRPPEDIALREVRENNLVTYLGTYAVHTEGPLTFDVAVRVEGEAVELNFADTSPRL